MKKGFKITAVVLGLLLLAGTLAFSVVTMLSVRAMAQEQADALERLEKQGQSGTEKHASSEDDVVIAGEYTIRSTTNISDAYLSGDSSQLSDKDKQTLQMASDILDEIITDGMTPYEKEQAVYEWMVANLEYDSGALIVIPTTGEDSDNPYGVLKYHNAVCVGYATTFRLFMQMLEIPCKVVHNSELYHSWDLVQLDGHWYHVDIYSDVGQTGHAYFNLPDDVRLQQQNWDTEFFPAADSLEYNYCWRNRHTVDNIFDTPAVLRQILDDGADSFALSLPAEGSEADAVLVKQMINALDNALMNNYAEGMPGSIREQNWIMDDDGAYCVLVSFNCSSDGPNEPDEPDAEALEKADDAMQDAFGDLFYVSIYDGGNYYNGWEGAKG